MRILKNDCTRYMTGDDDDELGEEDSGWKLVHGDVFRFPENSILFCLKSQGINLGDVKKVIYYDNNQNEYYLTDIFKMASNSDIKIKSVITSEKEVQGINDKRDLAMAENEFQENLRHTS